jgi:hypothetical protein
MREGFGFGLRGLKAAPFGFCSSILLRWYASRDGVGVVAVFSDLNDSIHGAGVDEGQARTNTFAFAEIAQCPRCQAESDAVSLVQLSADGMPHIHSPGHPPVSAGGTAPAGSAKE